MRSVGKSLPLLSPHTRGIEINERRRQPLKAIGVSLIELAGHHFCLAASILTLAPSADPKVFALCRYHHFRSSLTLRFICRFRRAACPMNRYYQRCDDLSSLFGKQFYEIDDEFAEPSASGIHSSRIQRMWAI